MRSETIHVEFEQPRHGWILSKFRAGPSLLLEIWASDVPFDSISGLAGALCLILKEGPEATVVWNEEPTEYEFKFVSTGNNLRLTVFRYDDQSRVKGRHSAVFGIEGDRLAICRPIWRALRRLQTSMPPSEYEAAWGHAFPDSKVKEIGAILDQAKGRE